MQISTKLQKRLLNFTGIAGLCVLVGCSSSSSIPGSSSLGSAAPMVVTVSDAPLSNILSAKVTISAVNLSTGSGGSSVSILSKPVTVELSSLGAIQEPIELTNLAFGTYNSATVTVTSAEVTYLNSTNQATTATATLSQPTITVALTPALTVNSQGEVQLQLAFNLAQSFSISGSTVTFAPAINTAGAQVGSENSGDRQLEVSGQVISVSASAITVQSGDSGRQFNFTINSTTQFPSGVTAGSIQTGSIVQVQGQTQTDGTLLATTITPESGDSTSGQQEDGAKGIIISVTKDSSGSVSAFTMVPRESFGSSTNNASQNVALSSSTTYGIPEDAKQIGSTAPAFVNTEIFPGQSVMVTGTTDSTGTLNAQQVTLAAQSITGTLAAAPQGNSPNFTFTLTLPSSSYLTTSETLTSLDSSTNQATDYGNGLSASSFAALAANSSIEIHGYLLQDNTGHFALYATEISQVEAPETPEGGNGTDN